MEETPFFGALRIDKIKAYHRIICELFILSIETVRGKEIIPENVSALKEKQKEFTSPHILLTLIETLLREKKEEQTITEEDDLMNVAAKILINRLISNSEG